MEELFTKLREKGITLWLDGESLKYQAAKGVMTRELLNEIGENKQKIIIFLQQVQYLKNADDKMEKADRSLQYQPVSYPQQSMWFFDKMNPGNSIYNIVNAFQVKGKFNEDYFNKACNVTAGRHESLRTVFTEENGLPERKIIKDMEFSIDIADLSQYREADRLKTTWDVIEQKAWKPFELDRAPLWKICLMRLSEEERIILLTIHHIIADAWSNRVFLEETMAVYHSLCGERPYELPEVTLNYSDYVHWQRKRFANEAVKKPLLSYWKTRLNGYETLMLPADRPRPPLQSFSGKTEGSVLVPELSDRIRNICLKEDVSMYMFLLTGFEILLSRYSSQTDIVLGTVTANRAREEVRDMIGFLINTIVIRDDLSGNPSVSEMLKRVKKTTLDDSVYHELPFDLLMEEIKPERNASRTPVFQVMYIHQSVENTLPEADGLIFEEMRIPSKIAPFDLRLSTSDTENGIRCTMDYSDALYEPSTVQALLMHYNQILEGMCLNERTGIQELCMLTRDEIKQVTEGFNRTSRKYPDEFSLEKPIHRLFEERVEEDGQRTALYFDREMSYTELNKKANQLAWFLMEQGVAVNTPVGICMERSFDMVIGILGILKAGGAYIPIDIDYPKDRMLYMLRNAGAALVLTDEAQKDVLEAEGINSFCFSSIKEQLQEKADTNPEIGSSAEDLVYIIYTSGSTGKPKGAMNTHKSVLNHKLWMKDAFRITREDILIQKTSFSFDVSAWEFFLPLIIGARLVIAKPGGHKDPFYLSRLIQEQRVTVLHFVPSMLRAFLEESEAGNCRSLQKLIVSGEALDYGLLCKAKEKLGIPVYNAYGPAECADIATMWECDTHYENHLVPIGKPISNVRIYLLDSRLNPVPAGVTGEIYIGGISVGKGYINDPALTKERFLEDPFSKNGGRMYKTGDLGRFLKDGNIAYEGRCDFQVKIRGMRIELGEIEKHVQSYPGIQNCAVVVWEKGNKGSNLAVYYTEIPEHEADTAGLKRELEKHLPDYMVPRFYTRLSELPLNQSGKLDRKSLPEPETGVGVSQVSFVLPETDAQKKLAEIWKEVLEVDKVGIHDNFFEIGGHSLLLIQAYKKIREAFQKEFSLIELFTYSTIHSLSLFLTEEDKEVTLDLERLERQKEAKNRHKRLPR